MINIAIGHLVKTNPIKANCWPSAANPKSEYRNPKQRHVRVPCLKKQSQFTDEQIVAILLITMVYGDFNIFERRKNKAKQSQIMMVQGSWFRVQRLKQNTAI
jgi:hypothetical protein